MAFYEVSFPENIAWGATGGPEWATDVFSTQGGSEQRNQNRSHYLGKWDVGLVNKDRAETHTLIAFFNAIAKGKAHGFRFKNLPNDDYYAVDEPIGTGDGADVTFQLTKRYSHSGNTYDKTIYKPIAGTVVMKLNGTPTTAFTVSTVTGIVTFSVAPVLGVAITATYLFELPVRFDVDQFVCTRADPDLFSWPSIPLVELLSGG